MVSKGGYMGESLWGTVRVVEGGTPGEERIRGRERAKMGGLKQLQTSNDQN